MSIKQDAIKRVQEKYRRALKKENNEQEAEERLRENKQYADIVVTEGWKKIAAGLQERILELQTELTETSSFRVFKCMDLRSDIKSLKTLYTSMLKAEKLAVLFALKA